MVVASEVGSEGTKENDSKPPAEPLKRGRITNAAEVVLRADENLQSIAKMLRTSATEVDVLKATAATADGRLAKVEQQVDDCKETLTRIWSAVQSAQKSEAATREEMSQDLVCRMGKQIEMSLDDRLHKMEKAQTERGEQLEKSKRATGVAALQKQLGELTLAVNALAADSATDKSDAASSVVNSIARGSVFSVSTLSAPSVPSAAAPGIRRQRDGPTSR